MSKQVTTSGPTLLFCLFNRCFGIWNILHYRLTQSVQQGYKAGRRNIKRNAFFRRSDKYSSTEVSQHTGRILQKLIKITFSALPVLDNINHCSSQYLKRNGQYIEYFSHKATQLGNSLPSNIFHKINMNGFIKKLENVSYRRNVCQELLSTSRQIYPLALIDKLINGSWNQIFGKMFCI